MESSSNKVCSVQGKDMNSSNSYCTQRPDLVTPRKLTKMTGCLEIIVGEDFGQLKSNQDSRCNSQSPDTFSGPGSGSFGSASSRADSSLSRRVITPSKQITLQAVRRKDDSAVSFADQGDWQSFGLKSNNITIWELGKSEAGIEPPKTLQHKEILHLEPVDGTSQQATQPSQLRPTEMKLQSEKLSDSSSMKISQEIEVINNNEQNSSDDDEEEDGDDSDDDDSSGSSEEEEEEKLKAPNELLMEFVDCLMRKDFQTSSKLCKMILLYEPENKEALKFQPLIEEKVALDAEAEKEAADEDNDSVEDDSDDSEDDDDSDSNEDSSDDDDSSSDDDSNNDEGNVSNKVNIKKTPSSQRSCQH